MTSTIAVLSDIHGVLPALEAVLAEPAVREAGRVVLAGDLAAGPMPAETLDLLRSLGDRAVWVRGNGDRELVELRQGTVDSVPDPIAPWAAAQLRDDQVEFLAALPATAELVLDGLGRVLFCHATPRDDEEVALVDSPQARWAEVLDGLDPGIGTVVCGHTHMPFTRLTHGRLVVNPGSVGMPYGRPGAHWALLGPGDTVQLRRTLYDLPAAVTTIATRSAYPEAQAWATSYVHAEATAEQALDVFGTLDGRG